MTRWPFRILICLLLGVVTTVGVAWGIAVWPPTIHEVETPYDGMAAFHFDLVAIDGEQRIAAFSLYTSWGMSAVEVFGFPFPDADDTTPPPLQTPLQMREEGFARLPNWSAARGEYAERYPFRDFRDGFICDRAFGWPRRAMAYSFVVGPATSGFGWILLESRGLVQLRQFDWSITDNDGFHGLPLRPIFSGFVINTFFYGLIWFGFLSAITTTRRTRCRRRGRCPKCGYDLRGDFDNGCSECGWGREGESRASGPNP